MFLQHMKEAFSSFLFLCPACVSMFRTVHTNMYISLSYAAVAMTTPLWYQTPDIVAAFIKLKGVLPDKTGDITARFGEQYCAVFMGGESPDEPMLPHFPQSLLTFLSPSFCLVWQSQTRAQRARPEPSAARKGLVASL